MLLPVSCRRSPVGAAVVAILLAVLIGGISSVATHAAPARGARPAAPRANRVPGIAPPVPIPPGLPSQAPQQSKPPELTSDGDGPPISITCVGAQVPAVVHVAAVIPEQQEAPNPAHPGQALHAGPGAPGTQPASTGVSPIACRYDWDFGDPDGKWNHLPGWNAAHIYDVPGKYTITLFVTEPSGKVHRRTTWVRVAPNDRRKVYVSSDGNDQLDGATPGRAVHTPQRAFQLGHMDAEVLFRKGDVWNFDRPLILEGHNLHVGNWADPNAAPTDQLPLMQRVAGPPKQPSIFYLTGNSRDVVFDGLAFDSPWGLESEYGAKAVPARAFTIGGTNVAVRWCHFNNVSDACNTELKPTGFLMQDNVCTTNIREYGYWGVGTDHVLIGNVMTESHQQHLMRCSQPGVTRLLIAYNDLSRRGIAKGSIELRCANWFYVADNHIDGGSMRVGPQDDGLDKNQYPDWPNIKCTWGVVQDNRLDRIFMHVRLGTEHVVVRDNCIHMDDGAWQICVLGQKPGWDDVRKIIDVTIENNTAINNGTKGNFIYITGKPQGLVVRNNLFIAPHLRENGGYGGSVAVLDNTMSGDILFEGNVYPTHGGEIHHIGKTEIHMTDWANQPKVKGDRYADLQVDANDNPPANTSVGAKLGTDKTERDAKKAAQGMAKP